MSTLTHRDVQHVFESLRKGIVPERGIDAFAVGIDKQVARSTGSSISRSPARARSSSCAAVTAAARPSWPA